MAEAWMSWGAEMEWEGKSKRNAVTEGGAVFILGGQRSVDPEGCKGGGISIRSQMCMICMIKEGATRLAGAKGRGSRPEMRHGPYSREDTALYSIWNTAPPGDPQHDWPSRLSESVIWRMLDAAQRHPHRVLINPPPLPNAALPPAFAPTLHLPRQPPRFFPNPFQNNPHPTYNQNDWRKVWWQG